MKKFIASILISIVALGCTEGPNVSKTIIITGRVSSSGIDRAISGVKLTAGTISGGIGGVSKEYASTRTDKEGNYKLEINNDQLPCQLIVYNYPDYNFVRLEDEESNTVNAAINETSLQVKNVKLDPIGFYELEIANVSGEYRRIQAQLSHYPHKAAFLDVGMGNSESNGVAVWAERPDTVDVFYTLHKAVGDETIEGHKRMPVEVLRKETGKGRLEF